MVLLSAAGRQQVVLVVQAVGMPSGQGTVERCRSCVRLCCYAGWLAGWGGGLVRVVIAGPGGRVVSGRLYNRVCGRFPS
jgi:uncharacterized membrane protein YeiH